MDIIEYFTTSGEVVERDYTPEEAAQRAKDIQEAEAAQAETAAQAAAAAAASAAAIAHAKSLGFTDEMIAVMYPNLGGNNE